MIDSITVVGLLGLIQSWIMRQDAVKVREDAAYREAITAIFAAVDATKAYLAHSPTPASTQTHLSELWTSAAISLRRIDPPLARRCRLKGRFWQRPEAWTRRHLEEANIRIAAITAEAEGMLDA